MVGNDARSSSKAGSSTDGPHSILESHVSSGAIEADSCAPYAFVI